MGWVNCLSTSMFSWIREFHCAFLCRNISAIDYRYQEFLMFFHYINCTAHIFLFLSNNLPLQLCYLICSFNNSLHFTLYSNLNPMLYETLENTRRMNERQYLFALPFLRIRFVYLSYAMTIHLYRFQTEPSMNLKTNGIIYGVSDCDA